jgi:hypothetical protein
MCHAKYHLKRLFFLALLPGEFFNRQKIDYSLYPLLTLRKKKIKTPIPLRNGVSISFPGASPSPVATNGSSWRPNYQKSNGYLMFSIIHISKEFVKEEIGEIGETSPCKF